jgi:hypothetical protein
MRGNFWKKSVLTCIVLSAIALSAVRFQARTASLPQSNPPAQVQPQAAPLTPQQLQDLVAPIALYPDALVAQILAGAA